MEIENRKRKPNVIYLVFPSESTVFYGSGGSGQSVYRHAFTPPGSTSRRGVICTLKGGKGVVSVI